MIVLRYHRVRILILLLIFFCGANFTAAQDTVRNYYPNGRIKEVYAVNIVGKDTIKSGHYTLSKWDSISNR